MTKKKKILISILALTGLALSAELCAVYYSANFVSDAKPSICAINSSFDCDSVARTPYSQFFGIPLACWGVFLYFFFLLMAFVDKLQNIKFLGFLKVFKNPSSYVFCIGLLSFIISITLLCISWFKIDSICVFCLMTYFVDLFIAISAKTKGISIVDEVKISFSDFIEALKVKRYLISFIIVLLLAAGFLTYTTVSNVFAPQVALQHKLKEAFKDYKGEMNGNRLGSEDADLVIHEYMDFNCGGCFIANLYLHRIIDEFENVAVVQHNLPLDRACNHNVVEGGGHQNSCLKSYYAMAALKQNKYWEMGSILFDSGVKTEKDILEKARLIDFDIKKLKADAASEEVKNQISDFIKDADKKGIDGTPTFFIGIKRILGIGSYPEFKKKVIEQGGREKPNHG